MRTRRMNYCSVISTMASANVSSSSKKSRLRARLASNLVLNQGTESHKKVKLSGSAAVKKNSIDSLPDELLLSIFMSISSNADSPADIFNIMLTCKRFHSIMAKNYPMLLSKASIGGITVKASQWCEKAQNYLQSCVNAGNIEACYTLGMIKFYCLQEREAGAAMLVQAGRNCHAGAVHALAVMEFNGSGRQSSDKNVKAGVALCARAASMGHVEAMRELGHCLQDGYGAPKNVIQGRRLIVQANLTAMSAAAQRANPNANVRPPAQPMAMSEAAYFAQLGAAICFPDIAHQFLLSWFHTRPLPADLRLCSHGACGRPETRKHEFRRCSACACATYCSRACQAMDWKLQHKFSCVRVAAWQQAAAISLVAASRQQHS